MSALPPNDSDALSDSAAETLSSAARQPASSRGGQLTFRANEEDLSGQQLGDYQLVRKLAEGGMGYVYEGIQLRLDRRVAVKVLSAELAREQEFLTRFQREAKSAAALNHPNVVQVYDCGSANGKFFFVMELVDGVDLSIHVKDHGKLPLADALNYFEQAVNALKFAARHAIIHRDVKPANLMLTRDGTVKVADLGLAKKLNDDSDVTLTGVGMGSPHFVAPEQADDASKVDHRADIYALGVTLLFLLTGKRPYEGASNFSVVLAHANKPLPTGVDLGTPLPDEVESFIRRLTAKHPSGRYQSYDELLTDLERVKAGQRPRVDVKLWLKEPRTLQYAAVGAAAVLLLALIVPMLLPDRVPARPEKSAANGEPGKDDARRKVPVRKDSSSWPQGDPANRPDDPRGFQFDGPALKGQGPSAKGPVAKGPNVVGLALPPIQEPEYTPLKDGPIPEMLAEADKYAAANPLNKVKIIDRYWQVRDKAIGTQWEKVTEDKLNNAVDAHSAACRELFAKFEDEMIALLKLNHPRAAMDVWLNFPRQLRTPEVDQKIAEIINRNQPNRPPP